MTAASLRFDVPAALRLCFLGSRSSLDADTHTRLQALIDDATFDWKEVLHRARHHAVMPLLYRTLRQLENVPPELLEALEHDYHANAHFAMLLVEEARKLFAAFAEQSVSAVPFKGIVLAQWAYGNVTYRTAGDLDVLVAPESYRKAEEVIRDLGYKPSADPSGWQKRWYLAFQHEFPFVKPSEGYKIDLHTALSARRFSAQVPAHELYTRSSPLAVGRATLPCLSPEDWLYVLTMHGAKHRWESLKWVCDVAEVFRAHHESLPVDAILATAEDRGAGRMLRLGVLLARHLLDAPVPAPLLRAAQHDRDAVRLVGPVVREMAAEQAPWPRESQRFAFHYHVRSTLPEKVRYLVGSAAWYALRPLTGAQH